MNDFVGYIDSTGKIFDGTFDYEGRVGPIGPQGPAGHTPVRGVDYWTNEDKTYVVAEATSLINGKIEEYNENATTKTQAFNDNATLKTNTFNSNASDKTTTFNNNATSKTSDYNNNATAKTTAFDTHVDSEFDELTGNFYTKSQTYSKAEVDGKVDLSNYYNKTETNALLNGKQNNLAAGANINIENDTISVDGAVITPITDSAIRIWNMDEGVYKLSNTTIKYNGSTDNTSITVGGGYLFIYSLGAKKAYYIMSDNLSDAYFYIGQTSSDSGTITRLMKKDEIKNNLTTTSEGYMLDARQGKALNESKEDKSNKVSSISSSSTDTQYPSAKLLYDQLQLKANHDNVAKDFWYGTQAQYDALATKDPTTIYMTDEDTTTPIATTINENSTNSEIAGAKAVYDNSLDTYSTTEQRVGTWIDGKPLYRKIIQNTVPATTTDNTGQQNNIDITNLNIDECFFEWASVYDSTYLATYQVPVFRVQSLAVRVVTTPTVLTVWNYNTLFNNNDIIISLLYTKTTDTATTTTLNTASLMNTGSLVGMGDRAELLANELAGKDVENTEQIDEQVKNISAEPIETKTEGSGDTYGDI